MSEKPTPPIISKLHRDASKEHDELISKAGYVSGSTGKEEGVRRKILIGEEEVFAYAYKEVYDIKEARKVMGIYQRMKDLGLPVVDFAKIRRRKSGEQMEYEILMEDLTEKGQKNVMEISMWTHGEAIDIIEQSQNPQQLREEMAEALATLHNNGIYDYHPGLSFALVFEDEREGVEFKIIDYANFETEEDLNERNPNNKGTFESECSSDLKRLLEYTCESKEDEKAVREIYHQKRFSGS